MKRTNQQLLWILIVLALQLPLFATTIVVEPGDDLDAKIESATGGDTVLIRPGTYSEISLSGMHFSEELPLVITSDGSGNVIVKRTYSSGTAFKIGLSSYILLENIIVEGGLWGLSITGCDHIIIRNIEVRNQGQEGIHVNQVSSYIDIVNNYIHDTGLKNSSYGEGIYTGTGASTPFPDNTENIWIEGNVIHDCGNGEGINIKSECFHVTVKGNTVFNIAPGTDSQYNQAAITVEGASNSINNDYRLTEYREVWVEENEVFDVSGGYSNWDNGIMVGGTGVYVINNMVHHCDDKGINGSSWADLGLPLFVYNNTLYSNGQDLYLSSNLQDVRTDEDPGSNPNTPQSWAGEYLIRPMVINLNHTSLSEYPGAEIQLEAELMPLSLAGQSVTWSSSAPTIADVDDAGRVTFLEVGSAVITASSEDGLTTASCNVSVKTHVSGVSINEEELILSVLKGYQLEASIVPENASNNTLLWASGDPTIARVSSGGFVTGIGEGQTIATVTTEDGGFQDTCWLSIFPRVSGIVLDPDSVSLAVFDTLHLSAAVSPGNVLDSSFTWQSSDSGIASINEGGELIGVSKGSTSIIVITTDGGHSDTCFIEVTSAVYTPAAQNIRQLEVYPNPVTSGNLTLILPNTDSEVLIFDEAGKLHYRTLCPDNSLLITRDLLPSGISIITVISGNESSSIKVLVL